MNKLIDINGQRLAVDPDFPRGKKGVLTIGIVSSIFLACSLWIVMTPGRTITLQLTGVILFSCLMFFTFLIQLTWGPLIRMDEQHISLRPNPFLNRIEVQWDEIDAFIPFTGRNHFFFEITLAPAHREAFLLRQSPSMRKRLAKRLERSPVIARYSQQILPCSQTALYEAIQELYHVQIHKYHISFE